MRLTKSYLNKYLVIPLETLPNKLINTKNKEEKIIVKNINKNKEKLYKQDDYNFVIQPSNQHINLIDAIRLILDFNETIWSDLKI